MGGRDKNVVDPMLVRQYIAKTKLHSVFFYPSFSAGTVVSSVYHKVCMVHLLQEWHPIKNNCIFFLQKLVMSQQSHDLNFSLVYGFLFLSVIGFMLHLLWTMLIDQFCAIHISLLESLTTINSELSYIVCFLSQPFVYHYPDLSIKYRGIIS